MYYHILKQHRSDQKIMCEVKLSQQFSFSSTEHFSLFQLVVLVLNPAT